MTGASVIAAAVRAVPPDAGRAVTLDAPVHPVIAAAVSTASTSLRRCLIGCRHLSVALGRMSLDGTVRPVAAESARGCRRKDRWSSLPGMTAQAAWPGVRSGRPAADQPDGRGDE